MNDAWTAALLYGGLGALNAANRGDSTASALSQGGLGALTGMQAVREAGRADREHMIRMAQLQSSLQDAAAERQRYADEMAAAQQRQDMIQGYAGQIQDPAKRTEFLLNPGGYLEAERKANAPMSAYQKAQIDLKKQDWASKEKKDTLDQRRNAERQGHFEAIAAGLPEEQRPYFWANPGGFIQQQQKAQNDEFSTEVARILAANPELAQSPEGIHQAQNIALGLVKSATDPVRGGTATYNLATGVGSPIDTPRPDLEPFGADGRPISIDQMAGEVGVIPFAEDVIARTIGQAAPSLVNEARTKAASQLDFLKQKAVTAFATSSRPPVIEQQRIASLFPSKGIFDSETRASQQLGHLRDLAVTTHDDYIGMINSGQLPFDQENELRGKVAELRQVVNMLPEQKVSEITLPIPSLPNQTMGDDPLGLFD